MIQVSCNCGRQFQVADKYGGQHGKCPDCSALLEIPKPQVAEMMAIRCRCGNSYKVKQEWLGKSVKCPNCQASIAVTATPAGGAADPLGAASGDPLTASLADDPLGIGATDPLSPASMGAAGTPAAGTPAGGAPAAAGGAGWGQQPGLQGYDMPAAQASAGASGKSRKAKSRMLTGILIGTLAVVVASGIVVGGAMYLFRKKDNKKKRFDNKSLAQQEQQANEELFSVFEKDILKDLKNPEKWVMYTSKDGTFQAKFPGEAFPENRQQPGGGVASRITFETGGLWCNVTAMRGRIPRSETVRKHLEAHTAAAAAGYQAEMSSVNPIKFDDKYDGVEAKAYAQEGNMKLTAVIRTYRVNNTTFVLVCFGRAQQVEVAADLFFKSFRLRDAAEVELDKSL